MVREERFESAKQKIKDKLQDDLKRHRIAKTWKGRCKRLKSRKNDPLTEEEFCKKHGISPTRFNRNKNLKATPTWEKINQVEAAFAAEGV